MSSLSFSFNPSAIPVYAQAEFINRFFQLVMDYQNLTTSYPPAPAAEDLPAPTSFVAVEGDDVASDVQPVAKKVRKNPWDSLTDDQKAERKAKMRAGRAAKAAERKMSTDSLVVPTEPAVNTVTPAVTVQDKYDDMTCQQLRDELADRNGVPPTPEGAKPSGPRRNTPKYPKADDLRAELRRRDALAPAPAPTSDTDAGSETSSKKARKNPWAGLTPEQHAARVASLKAAREAKKAVSATNTNA